MAKSASPKPWTLEEIFQLLPRDEQVIFRKLRLLILECIPKAEEKIYYGTVPFYRHHKMICFIWPPSIFWGPKRTIETQKKKGTALGFCQGFLMSNDNNVLLAEGRKQIYCMYFHSVDEINEAEVRAFLYEAGLIDETFAKKKKGKR